MALGTTVVALAMVAVTSVVSARTGAEALSVLALALAVIAFVVQLIVFIVEAAAASAQERRAERVHAATMTLLAQIQEKAEGTHQTVDRMNERVIEALVVKAQAESSQGGGGSGDFSENMATQLIEYFKSLPAAPTSLAPVDVRVPDASRLDAEMTTLPSGKEFTDAVALLREMRPIELSTLEMLGRDQLRSGGAGSPVKPGLRVINSPGELHEKGLVKRVQSGSRAVFVLTPKGKTLARVLITENIPADLKSEVDAARQPLRAFEARVQEAGRKNRLAAESIAVEQ